MVRMWGIVGQTPTWQTRVVAAEYHKETRFQGDYKCHITMRLFGLITTGLRGGIFLRSIGCNGRANKLFQASHIGDQRRGETVPLLQVFR